MGTLGLHTALIGFRIYPIKPEYGLIGVHRALHGCIWEFPKIGDPSIVP